MRRSAAAVLVEPSRFEMQEFDVPPIAPDEAVMRVTACGICGTDIEQRAGQYYNGPTIPGHEAVGIIEEIGPIAAKSWNVAEGDLVAIESLLPCGHCVMCRSGRLPCEGAKRAYGFIPVADSVGPMGGYAEYMRLVSGTKLHKMDRSLTPAVAAMFNPLGAGVAWAVKAGRLKLGDTMVVQGAGQRGLMCLIAARMAGAERVIVTDVAASAWKLDLAKKFGADEVIVADRDDPVAAVLDLTKGRGAEVVLDVSGLSTKPVVDAVDMVRAGGTIVLGAIKNGREVPGFVSDKLTFKGAAMRGVLAVDGDSFAKAVDIINRGHVPFAEIHTHSVGLKDADRAISLLAGEVPGERAFHVTVEPPLP